MNATSAPRNTAGVNETARAGVLHQAREIYFAIFASPVGRRLIVLLIVMTAAILATTYGQIVLNRWNEPFYDAITRRDMGAFFHQLGVYFAIVGSLLVLDVAQRWLNETIRYRLREGLTRDLLALWMAPRRAFWLATKGGAVGVNPDQRMTDDATKLCDISTDLSIGLFRSTVLFVSFASVLWTISRNFVFDVGGVQYAVPGFMLWAAIAYAAVGSLLSWAVGRRLVRLNADRYAREADLRFALVDINEHIDGISLAEGEADERRRAEAHLGNIMTAMRRLVRGLTNLTWVTSGFGWITGIAPILIATPLYFSQKTSFGGMMMAAAAFTQAQGSLQWFVENFSALADWRATLLRVENFRATLTTAAAHQNDSATIEYVEGAPGELILDNLRVETPAGRVALQERHVVIRPGQHVLIAGGPAEARTPVFRALSGLAPWGAGRIVWPRGESVMYVPRGTPYVPRGSLREVLAYPGPSDAYSDKACAEALDRVGLRRYAKSLDVDRRWDRELSEDEQMALALARVVLHAPQWVVLDDAFAAMHDETLQRVALLCAKRATRTTIIHIGRSTHAHLPMFKRVLHLKKMTDATGNHERHATKRARRVSNATG